MSDKHVPGRDGPAAQRDSVPHRNSRLAGLRRDTEPPRDDRAGTGSRDSSEVDPATRPEPTPSPRRKELPVETLRGVAIILMVMGHVVGSTSVGGLRVPDDSWYRYLYLTLAPMRMPLFTVISGYVYACRPLSPDRSGTFLAGKARRLLLPLVTISTIQYVFSTFGPEVSRTRELGDIWRIYYMPFDQFWFLQSIALVFLTVFVLELGGLMKSRWRWFVCLLGGAALYLAEPSARVFSVDGWGRLLVFFLLGVGLKRFHALTHGRLSLSFGGAILVVSTVVYQLTLAGEIDMFESTRWMTLGCGLGATYLLFRFRFVSGRLAWLGGYAFTIYLLHSFAVVISRIVGKRMLGIEHTEVLLLIGMILGLGLPIVGHEVFARFAWTRRAFLGLR